MSVEKIDSVCSFIKHINEDIKDWGIRPLLWFRGQSLDKPLKPKLFRGKVLNEEYDLIETFRSKAPILAETPEYDVLDDWLFLMQHHGLPTRLLDWTESALIALFFSVCYLDDDYQCPPKKVDECSKWKNAEPIVWMINPSTLNKIAIGIDKIPNRTMDAYNRNFQITFNSQTTLSESTYPIAILPHYIHKRMNAQKSCFTIHGMDKRGIDEMFQENCFSEYKNHLKKYKINADKKDDILRELRMLGVSFSTVFPDFEGLAKELEKIKL